MPKVQRAVIGLVTGCAVGAAAGYFGVELLSSNSHDRYQEAVMTAAFVTAPLGAVIGLIAGLVQR